MTGDRPDNAPGIERTPTLIDGMDTILGGGLVRGAAYIVQGPPGAGKTILSNQICFNHTGNGGTALYVSLLAESHDRMMAYMRQMAFYAPDRVPEMLHYISAYGALQSEGLGGVLKLMLQEIRRRKATLIVLDGLFVINDAAGGEGAFRRFVHEMQAQAAITRSTILMLTNQSRSPTSPEHTMVDGWIELTDDDHGLRAVRSLIVHKQRGSDFMRGRHFFRISDEGIRIFPRVEIAFDSHHAGHPDEAPLSSGIEALDDMLGGGYPSRSVTLLKGPTGIGKTSFGLHFLSRATAAEPGLMVSFFETPAQLAAKGSAIGLETVKAVENGALHLLWFAPAEELIDEILHAAIATVERTGAKRVFFDGLTALKGLMLYNGRLPLAINAMNRRLRDLGATIVYAQESSCLHLPNDLGGDDLFGIVDNLLLLHYVSEAGQLHHNMTILKLRDASHDIVPNPFKMTCNGVSFQHQRRKV